MSVFARLTLIVSVCFGILAPSQAQNKGEKRHTLSGYVRDAATGETLIGASLTVKGQGRGVSTNTYGF